MSVVGSRMHVTIVSCLRDNYAYIVTCEASAESAIVDASEAVPVLIAARALARPPAVIWSTHHHPDHTAGNEEVARELGIGEVVAHESDRGRVPGQTRFVRDGDSFKLGALDVNVLHVPGHTTGAVAYAVASGEERIVFTGDTLFVAGCGRLFEGTPVMMFASLKKLAALSSTTRVYCGHEYTLANLRFARSIEPSDALRIATERAERRRAEGVPTVPSTIEVELLTNPFLRAKDVQEFQARRAAKDRF